MKQREHNRSKANISALSPLRTAVLGFSILLSVPVLPACNQQISPYKAMELSESGDSGQRMKGIQALGKDETKLEYLALHSKHRDVRLAAVKRLKSSYYLQRVAIESEYIDASLAALDKIKGEDERSLPSVATDSKHKDVRLAAIDMIGADKNLLEVILHPDGVLDEIYSAEVNRDLWYREHEDVKIAAADMFAGVINKLDSDMRRWSAGTPGNPPPKANEFDTVTLIKVATYSTNEKVRMAIVQKLKGMDSYCLVDIATESLYKNTRIAAINGLKGDVSGLVYLALFSKYDDKTAIANTLATSIGYLSTYSPLFTWSDESSCEYALHYIFKYSEDQNAKIAALTKLGSIVNRLSDGSALMDVAVFSQDAGVRLTAVKRLKFFKGDEDALKYVIQNSAYEDTRNLAKELLTSKQ